MVVMQPKPEDVEISLMNPETPTELLALGIKIAQKPYIVFFLGPKALIYEPLDP